MGSFIDTNFLPVQVETSPANQALMDRYGVSWTPTILALDAQGKEHYRIVGFVPPEEFIPLLIVAKARFFLDTGQVAAARATLEEMLSRYPHPRAAAEAIFFLGVAKYKDTHDPRHLREAYEELKAKYPDSEWFRRAEPYQEISL
jgi:thioredoxin-related protein